MDFGVRSRLFVAASPENGADFGRKDLVPRVITDFRVDVGLFEADFLKEIGG